MASRAACAMLVVLLAIAGCSPLAAEQPTERPFCLQGPVRAVLQVDTADPRVIWGTNVDTGQVFDLRLPSGYGVNERDQIVDPEVASSARPATPS